MDNDEIVLEDAKESAFQIDKAYRRAVRAGNLADVRELKPQVDQAFDAYSTARLNLMEAGMLATDDDVAQMRRIRAEIEQAADRQELVAGAIKLAAYLARFA